MGFCPSQTPHIQNASANIIKSVCSSHWNGIQRRALYSRRQPKQNTHKNIAKLVNRVIAFNVNEINMDDVPEATHGVVHADVFSVYGDLIWLVLAVFLFLFFLVRKS